MNRDLFLLERQRRQTGSPAGQGAEGQVLCLGQVVKATQKQSAAGLGGDEGSV